jgi:phosphate starvation-inducible membrane PsiE
MRKNGMSFTIPQTRKFLIKKITMFSPFIIDRCLSFSTSFGHCVVCSSLMCEFWLPLWYLLAIGLSVLVRCVDSDYLFGIFWPLMAKRYQRGNQNPHIEQEQTTQWPKDTKEAIRIHTSNKNRGFWLPLWYLLAIVLSVLVRCVDSDYLFGIFWPLCCLFLFDVWILIASLVSFGHCVVCSCSMCG